eukprot:1302655-Pleurochrysis_carterae.AAC.1
MESSGSAKPVQAGRRTGGLHERRRRSAPRDGGREGRFICEYNAGGGRAPGSSGGHSAARTERCSAAQ